MRDEIKNRYENNSGEELLDKKFPDAYNIEKEIQKLRISSSIKNMLKEVNAKIILTKMDKNGRNKVNVYVASATNCGGMDRICYMKISEENLEICEFRGSRGDRYSGFYQVFLKKMFDASIISAEEDLKNLPISVLSNVLGIISEISEKQKEDRYFLKSTGRMYTRITKGSAHEILIQYYEEKENESSVKEHFVEKEDKDTQRCTSEKEKELNEIKSQIVQIYERCVDGSINDCIIYKKGIAEIKKMITDIEFACNSRLEMADQVRKYKS